MTTLFEPAYAKVNLTLDVLGKRDDGYHDIRSIMQTISIRDDIEIDIGTGKPWSIECSREGIPLDERNLAWKAAKLYCETMKKDPDGITIRIEKRIPSEAGMGGGSADAAAVLLGRGEQNLQMIVVGFAVDFQNHAANFSAVHDNAVGFVLRIVNAALDGVAGDDFAVIVDVVVALAELLQCAVFERPLVVENELLTVVGGERNEGYGCVFHDILRSKK